MGTRRVTMRRRGPDALDHEIEKRRLHQESRRDPNRAADQASRPSWVDVNQETEPENQQEADKPADNHALIADSNVRHRSPHRRSTSPDRRKITPDRSSSALRASLTAMVTEPDRSLTLHVPQVPDRQALSMTTPMLSATSKSSCRPEAAQTRRPAEANRCLGGQLSRPGKRCRNFRRPPLDPVHSGQRPPS